MGGRLMGLEGGRVVVNFVKKCNSRILRIAANVELSATRFGVFRRARVLDHRRGEIRDMLRFYDEGDGDGRRATSCYKIPAADAMKLDKFP